MAKDKLSLTFAALADPTRRAILARLAEGEATVNELAAPHKMSLPSISRHLKVLERAGLIVTGKSAQWRPRRLEPAPLHEADAWMAPYREFFDARLARLDRQLKKEADEQHRSCPVRVHPQLDVRRSARRGLQGLDGSRPAWLVLQRCAAGPERAIEVDLRVGGVWRQLMVISEETAYYTGRIARRSSPTRSSCSHGARGRLARARSRAARRQPLVTVTFANAPEGTELTLRVELPRAREETAARLLAARSPERLGRHRRPAGSGAQVADCRPRDAARGRCHLQLAQNLGGAGVVQGGRHRGAHRIVEREDRAAGAERGGEPPAPSPPAWRRSTRSPSIR